MGNASRGAMATGWVRKWIQATEITLAMFNHIRDGIGRVAGYLRADDFM
jgi:hypothetical protein